MAFGASSLHGQQHVSTGVMQHMWRAGATHPKFCVASVLEGRCESWQSINPQLDIIAVWEKYQDTFYGDYQPVQATCRR